MSLLLDALKRSEKARQEKAAQEAGDGPAETREFSLETLEEEAKDPRNQPDVRTPRDQRPRVAETVERSAVMDAEDMDAPEPPQRSTLADTVEGFPDMESVEAPPDDTADRGVEPPGSVHRQPVGETGEGQAFSLLDEEPVDERAVSDTGGTLPSEKSVRGAMDQYFDGTHSVALSMREVRRAMDTDEHELREESGEHSSTGRTSTTQRRARTVVDARAAASRARRGSGAWVWMLLLLLVGGSVAGGGWYYYTTVLGSGSSLFAGVPAPPRPAPAPQPVPAAQPETPAASVAALVAQPAPLPEPPARGELAATAEPVVAEPPATIDFPAPPIEDVMFEPEQAEPADQALPPREVADRLAAAIQKAGIGAQTGGIRITRASRKDKVSPVLTDAFDAFQRGDDASARDGWQRVLRRDPDNRDALLGLAAVSVRAGQPREAGELYLRVLRARPRDRLAQASLIALSDQMDPVAAESRIKLLLESDAEAPYLHFILGNMYATQSRWALAQESYFNAYRLDRNNADYAFNLAVSLDHLAQSPAALGFYQHALQLSDSRPVGFEPASVMNRIRVMTADAAGQ